MSLDHEKLLQSYSLLKGFISPSPLVKNEWLSSEFSCEIYLKLENMLPVGSFKMRGAVNKILTLNSNDEEHGVIAASAGNHAQGVAWAARMLGIKSTIVMPKNSPMTKIENTKSLGAQVILFGLSFEEAYHHAKEVAENRKLIFIHPYEDDSVIAGQASIGFELQEQLPQADYILGSIGGGGLMSGLGLSYSEIEKKPLIIGTQALGASSMVDSLNKGKLKTNNEVAQTFADGIKVKDPSEKMFHILQNVVDEQVAITDEDTAAAVLELMEKARIIAEGAGAINLAAFKKLYQQKPERFKGKKVVLIICGGNIDINLVDRIIEKGLIHSYRKAHFSVTLNDKPGALNQLTRELSRLEANVLQIYHSRGDEQIALKDSQVNVTIECKNKEHLDYIASELLANFNVSWE